MLTQADIDGSPADRPARRFAFHALQVKTSVRGERFSLRERLWHLLVRWL
ncbi:MAG TPA: hypothetical protein VF507_07325 [Pyrinomonadaceae bacterium]